MRNLSDLEKQVLKALVNHPHCSEQGLVQMATVVDDYFMGPARGISVYVGSDNKQVFMSIPENDIEILRSKFLIVITVFNILKYLTEEGLIILLGDKSENIILGSQYSDGKTTLIPSPIADYIKENLTKYTLVTEELKNIVLNKYKDAEHRRHHQVINISIVAIVISLFLGGYGTYESIKTGKDLDGHIKNILISEKESASSIFSAVNALQSESVDYMSLLNDEVHTLEKTSKELERLNSLVMDRTLKHSGNK